MEVYHELSQSKIKIVDATEILEIAFEENKFIKPFITEQ